MSRFAFLAAFLALLSVLPSATGRRGSSSLELLLSQRQRSAPSSAMIPEDLQQWAPLYLPKDIAPGQLNYFNFTRPEGVRELWLYVPNNYSTSVAWPLAFYFHGYGIGPVLQNGYHQGIYLNMTTDAEAAGYLIAFGQGTPTVSGNLAWDAGRCCKTYNSSMVKVDDVTYTRIALRMIEAAVKVNPARRYAMGWSNGGFMTERLACEAPDLFAGICADASSVVIGDTAAAGQAMCDSSFGQAHLDYIHLSGTSDTAVSWAGSSYNNPAGVPSALDDLSRWVDRMGCGPRFRQTYNDGVFSNLVWEECRNRTTVEFMTARNGQHNWWTKTVAPGFPFETTTYVLNFFTRAFNRRHQQ